MALPEHTTCLGTASVLPPAPTILSSCVCINHEPACRDVGGERGDEVEEKDKGRDGNDLDEDGDEGEGGEYEDMDEDEEEEMDKDEEIDGEEDVPVVHFGPPKGHPVSGHVKSVTCYGNQDADVSFASTFDSNKYILVTIIIIIIYSRYRYF